MSNRSRKFYVLVIALFIVACQSNAMIALTVTPITSSTSINNLPQQTPSDVPTVFPINTDIPTTDATRIQVTDTTMVVSPGDLDSNAEKLWVFGALAGQAVVVNLATDPANGAMFSVFGADGTILLAETPGISLWKGTTPYSQDYYIRMRSTSTQNINFTLSLTLPPLTPPTGTRIHFLPNTIGWKTNAILPPNTKKRYIFAAFGGQQMNVNLSTNPANSAFLYIWSADGTVYTLTAPTQAWSGILPANQDYYVEVRSASAQNVTYHLDVEIPAFINPPTQTATPLVTPSAIP